MKPRVGILTGFGINADEELGVAFELAGGLVERIPVTTLVEEPGRLREVQILGFPGGFSFGDHLGSGRVLAQIVRHRLKEHLVDFVDRGGLVLGVCNGFQVLVKMGILPNLSGDWTPETTLIANDIGTFQDRWVPVSYQADNPSPWIRDLGDADLPIRHGEGRFLTLNASIRQQLADRHLIAVRYRGHNPNGAEDNIAGITDPTGRIFGLMPHPEAFVTRLTHPLWRRRSDVGPLGLRVFQNAVATVSHG